MVSRNLVNSCISSQSYRSRPLDISITGNIATELKFCLPFSNPQHRLSERSLSSNKKKTVNSERILFSDESISALRTTKDAVRVTGHGQAHAIYQSLNP